MGRNGCRTDLSLKEDLDSPLNPKRNPKSQDLEELLKFGTVKQYKIYEKDITIISKI
jgi:hypothetical protein